jgi:hypothetical protein
MKCANNKLHTNVWKLLLPHGRRPWQQQQEGEGTKRGVGGAAAAASLPVAAGRSPSGWRVSVAHRRVHLSSWYSTHLLWIKTCFFFWSLGISPSRPSLRLSSWFDLAPWGMRFLNWLQMLLLPLKVCALPSPCPALDHHTLLNCATTSASFSCLLAFL